MSAPKTWDISDEFTGPTKSNEPVLCCVHQVENECGATLDEINHAATDTPRAAEAEPKFSAS